MSHMTVTIKCPGCESGNNIAAKHPSLTGRSQAHFKCQVCGSGVASVFTRDGGRKLKVESRIQVESQFLKDVREEARQEALEKMNEAAANNPAPEAPTHPAQP
jgi:transposase-like protein